MLISAYIVIFLLEFIYVVFEDDIYQFCLDFGFDISVLEHDVLIFSALGFVQFVFLVTIKKFRA